MLEAGQAQEGQAALQSAQGTALAGGAKMAGSTSTQQTWHATSVWRCASCDQGCHVKASRKTCAVAIAHLFPPGH